ncbi:MAG: MgtC/SapB family protein [Lachnospiraceae bacterium]
MNVDALLRLLTAVAVGAVVGWQREMKHRPAGLRTHILVALGAAFVTYVGYESVTLFQGKATVDPNRIAAQVVNGIGFIGAGAILKEGANVKGMNIAAGVWAVACHGVTAGAGQYQLTLISFLAILVVVFAFQWIGTLARKSNLTTFAVELTCRNASSVITAINELVPETAGKIDRYMAEEVENAGVHLKCTIQLYKRAQEADYRSLLTSISVIEGIENLSVVQETAKGGEVWR